MQNSQYEIANLPDMNLVTPPYTPAQPHFIGIDKGGISSTVHHSRQANVFNMVVNCLAEVATQNDIGTLWSSTFHVARGSSLSLHGLQGHMAFIKHVTI